MNDFDKIAGFYDPLKRLAFGKKLDKAATHFLNHIGEGDRVLVLGGGSGEMLDAITNEAQIIYLEKSSLMIRNAKEYAHKNVTFHCGDFMEFEGKVGFDWVVCPYFLDVFESENLKLVIHEIQGLLSKEGKLIVADFQKGKWYQNLFVSLMYLFFRWTTNIENKSLNNIHEMIMRGGFSEIYSKCFVNGMVFSRVYLK